MIKALLIVPLLLVSSIVLATTPENLTIPFKQLLNPNQCPAPLVNLIKNKGGFDAVFNVSQAFKPHNNGYAILADKSAVHFKPDGSLALYNEGLSDMRGFISDGSLTANIDGKTYTIDRLVLNDYKGNFNGIMMIGPCIIETKVRYYGR